MLTVLLEPISAYHVELLGFAASGATLCAFAQKHMMPMRISAVVANVFFIGYGAMGQFYPVLLLHVVLLPLNASRLVQQIAEGRMVQPSCEPDRCLTLVEDWQHNRALYSYASANLVPDRPLIAANGQHNSISVAS